jgi:hypothetical protein
LCVLTKLLPLINNLFKNLEMDKSKTKDVAISQFFVQKAGLIGALKRLLIVTNNSVVLNTLPFDQNYQEVILYSDISGIDIATKNPNEFVIISKKGTSTSIICSERNLCLCEIYKAWDQNILSVSPKLEKSFLSCDAVKLLIPDLHDLYIDLKVVIYRGHLELIHNTVHIPTEMKGKLIPVEKSSGLKVHNVISIPFCNIGTIYKTHLGLLIEMKDSSMTHSLVFYDLEKTNNILNQIQRQSKEYTGALLEENMEEFNEGIAKERIKAEHYKSFFFTLKVYKLIEPGYFIPLEIALSDSEILEIDNNSQTIIQRYSAEGVRDVIRMNKGVAGIQIVFEDSSIVTYVPPSHYRGLLLSNIFTVANWKRNNQEQYKVQYDFIHSHTPNYSQKTFGWTNNDVDTDYEMDLIKKFSNPADDDSFYNSLREFTLNASLQKFIDNEPKPLQFLIQLFCKKAKLLITKEFMSYWDLYQQNLNSAYNYEFGDNKMSEESHKILSKGLEEKLKLLTTKFQFDLTEAYPSLELNAKTLPIIFARTEDLLKAIIILISSKPLFREISTNKRESEFYQDFLVDLSKLIDSPYPTLSHLAGCFFRSFCRFSSPTEKKVEAQNKHFLLSSKVNILKIISENLAKKVLIKKKDQKEFENFYILSILACLRILKTFLYERKESTNLEDLQTILKQLTTPYWFAIFNYISRYRSIPCVYNATIVINAIFQNCPTREVYKTFQNQILNNSTLILLHIVHALSSISVLQRKISVILLSHLFVDNANACALVCRIFPKNLFRKVDSMSNDISKWTLEQWEQFFTLATKNFNTATEQWNDDCRQELLSKLLTMDKDINSKFNYCPSSRISELFDPNTDSPGEFLLNIRWNHEEVEIKYNVLQNKLLVWKYYLTTLLHDGEKPKLNAQITHALKFWNELNVRFMGTTSKSEMKKMLKVMILLYDEHHSVIRDLNTMHFWLKCLKYEEYIDCRYLILQLLYTSFTVEDSMTTKFNIKKFVDSNGLQALADVLSSLYFAEDHNALSPADLAEIKKGASEDVIYNYTKLKLEKQAYGPSLEKSCMIFFILNIYKAILQRPRDKAHELEEKLLYPIPNAKYQIIESNTIQPLLNILLLNDDDLIVEVVDFLTQNLSDKFTYRSITNDTPLYDFLLLNINERTIQPKFELVLKLYHRIAEDVSPEENYIKIYTKFSFEILPPEVIENALRSFPILQYFPKHFIWRLINLGVDDFIQIYKSNNYESPELIWSSFMREKLSTTIEMHLQEYRHELVKYSETHPIASREDMPVYSSGTADIQYTNSEVIIH